MARTVQEIKEEILAAKASYEELQPLNSTSKTAIWGLWVYIIAICFWTLEKLFDVHEAEVEEILLQKTPHTLRWYRNKALDFMYGYGLIEDTDKYNLTGLSDQEIERARIIKYSAVVEAEDESRLIIKIATEINSKLQPITATEIDAFDTYINEIKDAGVPITVINYLPDLLRLDIRIFRDPQLLDENGVSRLTGKKPVEVALQEFMKELPFNGELILQSLQDKLQLVEGVHIAEIDQAQTAWVDATTGVYGNYQPIDVRYIPVSGYFEIENFNRVQYVV